MRIYIEMKNFVLKDLSLKELTACLQRAGFPVYRAGQIFNWLYKNFARSIAEMSNLPKELRQFLSDNFEIGGINCVEDVKTSSEGTEKYLFRLSDGSFIEGVLMSERSWRTLCVSTQVGCPLACAFCCTGAGGFIRNLSVSEIVDQVLLIDSILMKKSDSEENRIRNVVMMGMGEPMLNIENVIKALKLMTAPDAIGLSPKRITVSTCGIPEGIKRLGEADIGVKLAISLNAVDNSIRSKLMPINKKYPIDELIKTCREFPLTKRRRITFEYVLIDGLTASPDDAKKLAKLLKGFSCKINLIPFNPHSEFPNYFPPAPEKTDMFRKYLSENNFTVAIRYSKGKDIMGACGQLAGHVRKAAKP